MICPYCGAEDQLKTIESRPRKWGVKRIKKCIQCNGRFSTIEVYEVTDDALESLRKSKMIRRHKRSK